MTPANRTFDVFGAASLLEQPSESLAVEGIARFEFPDSQLGLGHACSLRINHFIQVVAPFGRGALFKQDLPGP